MSTIVCPTCQTSMLHGDRFCEVCGTPLATISASIGQPAGFAGSSGSGGCQKCGAPKEAMSEDGYCNLCGFRNRPIAAATASIPPLKISLSPSLAGVSDRGLRYPQNEDHLALWQTEQHHVLVVCDGVSSSNEPQLAAQTASQVACDVLQETLFTTLDENSANAASDHLHLLMEDAVQTAIAKAQHAVAQLVQVPDLEDNPPSTTIVAAAVSQGIATIGWVGDSRAYWISHDAQQPSIAQQLTTDHSWLNDQIQAGKLSLMEARSNPKAHAITRWLGADAEPEKPEIVRFSIARAGYLLLCSDGLWNYLSDADHLSHLIAREIDAATIAQRLVDYANAKGGRDNITVAVLKVT